MFCWVRRVFAVVLACLLVACGGDDSDSSATGTIAGRVLTADTGAPIADALVSVGSASVRTNAEGRFELSSVPVAERAVVKVDAANFGEGFGVAPVMADSTATVSVYLAPSAPAQTFAATEAATLTVPDSAAQVALPANALVTASGATASGAVTARLTPIDPARDPRSMPGDYTTNTGAQLESFGALGVVLTDADGNRLNLRSGAQATIRIPVPGGTVNPPATVPLFHFDEASGRWVEQGSATLRGTVPNQYYEGSVTHFSIWNADRITETIYVHGCLRDPQGRPVLGASVVSQGIDYYGTGADLQTDANGNFSVPMRRGGRALVYTDHGHGSNQVEVGPSDTDISLSTCLVLNASAGALQVVVMPQDITVPEGEFILWRANVRGTGPFTYQWQHNGVSIPGATSAVHLAWSLSPADAGSYTVVVGSPQGSASATAQLTVGAPAAPTITVQPQSQQVAVGDSATFSITVGSAATIQWQRNGVDIPGATSNTYTFGPAVLADSNSVFTATASDRGGSTVSATATLTVTASAVAPSITTQPLNLSVTAGQAASFSVQVTGTAPIAYQWRRNGTNIPGANAATYVLPSAAVGDSGSVFTVVASNAAGSVTSNGGTLTVAPDDTQQKVALMRLLWLSGELFEAGAAPLLLLDDNFVSQASSAVCDGGGSVAGLLNGSPLAAGVTPSMSATLAATFNQCVDDGMRHHGSSSIAYNLTSMEPAVGSATASISNLRIADGAGGDVTSNGSISLNFAGSIDGTNETSAITITPGAGSTLRNEVTGTVASFASGSLQTRVVFEPATGATRSSRFEYTALRFTVAGVSYQADGAYELTFTNGSVVSTGSGEVVLRTGSTVVGRVFANNQGLFIEVNGQVVPF